MDARCAVHANTTHPPTRPPAPTDLHDEQDGPHCERPVGGAEGDVAVGVGRDEEDEKGGGNGCLLGLLVVFRRRCRSSCATLIPFPPPYIMSSPQLLHGAQLVEGVALADLGGQLCQRVGAQGIGAHLSTKVGRRRLGATVSHSYGTTALQQRLAHATPALLSIQF